MKKMLAMILIGLLLLAGCGNSKFSNGESRKMFENDILSFDYPESWKIIESPENSIEYIFSAEYLNSRIDVLYYTKILGDTEFIVQLFARDWAVAHEEEYSLIGRPMNYEIPGSYTSFIGALEDKNAGVIYGITAIDTGAGDDYIVFLIEYNTGADNERTVVDMFESIKIK